MTPDTLLRWHRRLIATKWDYSAKRGAGRPRIAETIRRLVAQFALENPWRGYTKIQGTPAHIGNDVPREASASVLPENGIEPAPERKWQTTWKTFLKAHWDVLGAIDFTTIEVWTSCTG